MATKQKEKTATKKAEQNQESTLYYFYSQGCGWCKRAEPLIDELNKEGNYNILKLDLADGDNAKLQNEIKSEYNIQCGTPLLVDAETGNKICGFREKDILEKWAKGEEIPEPPKPKGPPPAPPQDFDNEEEVLNWRDGYEQWVKDNDHMPNLPKPDDMLDRLKKQKEMMAQRQAAQAGAPGGNPQQLNMLDNRIRGLDTKLNILEDKLDQIIDKLGS